eukprot:1154334-Pelagomonas_calceolata.AAC.1
MKGVPRTDSRYPLRSKGGYRENSLSLREHSAPATASPPAFKVRHPNQILPGQRHIHLEEANYCEGTRSKNQLEASKQQHHNLCSNLSRASA